ncbi:MbtH family NRPS accessory protein [Streptomyces smyrnaeus]
MWPAWADVPAGRAVAQPESDRAICLAHIERHWTDMRPAQPG